MFDLKWQNISKIVILVKVLTRILVVKTLVINVNAIKSTFRCRRDINKTLILVKVARKIENVAQN